MKHLILLLILAIMASAVNAECALNDLEVKGSTADQLEKSLIEVSEKLSTESSHEIATVTEDDINDGESLGS